VSKLRIILNGFSNYLTKKKISELEIEEIMYDINLFLQEYHLGYSEVALDELDHTDFSSFFEDFVAKKWFGVSKNQVLSLCRSLKHFVEFLRETLNFYRNEIKFKKVVDSLNSDLYVDLIDDSEQKEDESSIYIGEQLEGESIEEFIVRNLDSILFAKEKLREESEKEVLLDLKSLKETLSQWYDIKEINLVEQIQENFKKNHSEIKEFSKDDIIAAIDYSLTDILKKKCTQQQIAKRNNISVTTLVKIRSLLSPYIPLELFYPNFLSDKDIKSNCEKTYIFKVNCLFKRKNWMKIEMRESQTLEELHYQILFQLTSEIFEDINYDKSYSFYMTGKEVDYKKEYCGPSEYVENDEKSAFIALKKLNLGYRQKFLYLYDYSVSLKYSVQLIGIGLYNSSIKYPKLINSN